MNKRLLLLLAAAPALLLATSCASVRPLSTGAHVRTLEEGRDYSGWTPTPPKCQQRPFFSGSLK